MTIFAGELVLSGKYILPNVTVDIGHFLTSTPTVRDEVKKARVYSET